MHYFSHLFDKVVYMFRTGPLSIIKSISTLYTRYRLFVMLVLLVSASVVTLADTNRTSLVYIYINKASSVGVN